MPIPLLAIAAAMAAAGGLGSAIGSSRREGEEFRNPLEDNPENQTIDPGESGFFNSVLEAIGRPGKIINNALIGNWEGAGRQGVDLLGDVVDSVLPGDWIPHISRRMDKPEFSDVLGGMDPGLGKFAVDVLGGAATDPTMLIPGAALSKVGKAGGELLGGGIRRADKLLPGTADAVAKAGRTLRSTFAAERISPETAALRQAGESAGSVAGQAQTKVFHEAMQGLDDNEAKLAFQIVNDYTRDAAGKAVPILGDTAPLASDAEKAMAAGLTPGVEAGRQVDPLRAGEFMQEVKGAGKGRGRIDPLAADVGIKGVADPLAFDLLSDEAKARIPGLNVFNKWEPEQQAAARTLNRAYPLKATDPRFASGIDLANASVQAPGGGTKIPLFRPEAFPSGFKEPNLDRIARKESIRDTRQAANATDPLTGGHEGAATAETPPAPAATFDTIENQIQRYGDRIDALKLPPEQAGKLKDFFARFVPLVQGQYRQEIEKGAMYRVPGVDIAKQMPADYAHRRFTGLLDEEGDIIGGSASSSKERTLRTNQSLRDRLNDPTQPGKLEEDIRSASLFRAAQSGQKIKSATMAQKLIDDAAESARAKQAVGIKTGAPVTLTTAEEGALKNRYKAFNEPGVSANAKQVLDEMSAAGMQEDAQVLKDHLFGTAPRGAVTALLAKANVPFKRAAVAGFVIPKFGADVRNRLSGIWQAASNPESRKAVPGMIKRFVSDIAGSVSDALGMKMGRDKFTKILADWEDALTHSGGSSDAAVAAMAAKHPEAAELIKNGVLDGYTRAEDLINDLARTPFKRKLKSISEFPQRIMRGLEDRMRLGMGLDLMAAKDASGASIHSAADASRITGDSLYRYGSGSAANRTARDIFPFFQFTAKAVPQQAKFLAEHPEVATALSRAQSSANDPDAPVYPYMKGKLNIPLGLDANGDQQFINGLGLPFESLSMIPDVSNGLGALGRSIERDTIGASQPLLKTAFGAVSGEDPYFESGFGSYGKMPLIGEAGAAGRAYNLAAGTGLLQPLDSPLRLIDKAIDDRRGAGMKALDLLTGANVTSVDPNKALQQQLQQQLEQNPTVHSYQSLYSTDSDPATQQMLEQYKQAKRHIKERRAQEASKAKAADVL